MSFSLYTGEEKEYAADRYTALRARLGELFESEAPEGRLAILTDLAKELATTANIDPAPFLEKLAVAADAANREDFVEDCVDILHPILRASADEPEKVSHVARERALRERGFQLLNQLVAYKHQGDILHIETLATKFTSMGDKIYYLRDGIAKLRELVQAKPEVQLIRAVSPFIAEQPELLTKMGFRIFKEARPEGEKHENGSGQAWQAEVSREDFLNPTGSRAL